MSTEAVFQQEDIEDVRIIIKAKGKHYSIVPKKDMDKEECRAIRIELMRVMFQLHDVVDTPLEDLKVKLQPTQP
jgi:hypothetical protein